MLKYVNAKFIGKCVSCGTTLSGDRDDIEEFTTGLLKLINGCPICQNNIVIMYNETSTSGIYYLNLISPSQRAIILGDDMTEEPTEHEIESEEFDLIWNTIKHWKIQTPQDDQPYTATGQHVVEILRTLTQSKKV